MSATQVAASERRAGVDLPPAAAWVHYGSLLLGAAALLYLSRGQWFYFDEWDIIWQEEGLRRFVQGHNGHWSAVPIGAWTLIQNIFGLGSYLPFVALAIAAHLTVAHLLWRILQRVGTSAWISTALAATFVFLGAAGENLLWAFQMGFMGGIALGLGALLIVMRPRLGIGGLVGSIALLTLGAATAGTALPFFFAVLVVALYQHGWRKALLTVGIPAAVYLVWYVAVAGPNPTEIYRAQGFGQLLRGIPEFVGTMFVGAFDAATPVPGFGIVVVTGVTLWAILRVAGRALAIGGVTAIGLLGSGLLFSALTAYSRLGLGVGSATDSRYLYVVIAVCLPSIGLILTRLASHHYSRLLAIVGLIMVVLVFNAGSLVQRAGGDSARELGTGRIVSAALALAQRYPEAIDMNASPDPVYLPRTLAQMKTLVEDFGLNPPAYDEAARLTALLTVGVSLTPIADIADDCATPLAVGSSLSIDASGVELYSPGGARITVHATDGTSVGLSQTLALSSGSTRVTVAEPVDIVVEALTAPVSLCGEDS